MPHTIKNRWKAGKQKKKLGFLARMKKKGKAGRDVLRRRRQKGRAKIAV